MTRIKCRNAAWTLAVFSFVSAGSLAQSALSLPLKVRQLTPDYYVIESTNDGQAAVPNLSIYVTGEGVIVVDPWYERDYPYVIAAVRSITDQPVRYVINTHFHSDHSGSNASFLPITHVVAQDNARKHMVEHNLPGLPDVTFGDEMHLYLGGKEVILRYLGRGHTDGDIAVYFPEGRIVCLGDMMAGTRDVTNPVVDYANGGNLSAWPASLDRALAFDVAVVIPGHGTITDRAGLVAHRQKVARVAARLRELIANGKSKDQIQSALISEFDFKPINLNALDGLIAEFQH
jgi:cyclase